MNNKHRLSAFICALLMLSSSFTVSYAQTEETPKNAADESVAVQTEVNAEENGDAELFAGVSETLYDRSAVSGLRINSKDFEHNGESMPSDNIAGKFSMSSVNHAKGENSSSNHPAGYGYFHSSDFDSKSAWSYETKWTPTDEEKEILRALTNDNVLQMGARYDAFRDTYNNKNSGYPYLKIKGGETQLFYHKLDSDYSKETRHKIGLGWSNISNVYDSYYYIVGGTTGYHYDGLIFDTQVNAVRIRTPELFIKDITVPYVKKVEVVAKTASKDFVYGETVDIAIIFNEPVIISDYSKVTLKVFDGNATPVSYNDKTKTLTMRYTVRDREQEQASKGKLVLSLSIPADIVTDFGGNVMDSISNKNYTISDAAISGYVPRVSNVSFKYAEIKDTNGNFIKTNEPGVITKPGDKLYFDVIFNQNVRAIGDNTRTSYKTTVGSSLVEAELYGIVKDNGVEKMTVLNDDQAFRTLRFVLTVPDSAVSGDKIYIPAVENSGKWELTDNQSFFGVLRGNETLGTSFKRLAIDPVSAMTKSGNYVTSVLTVDSDAPAVELLTESGEKVGFYNADDADIKTTEKPELYTLYVKADEELRGGAEVYLEYFPKSDPDRVTSSYIGNIPAYTDATGISGGKPFKLNLDIPGVDSADFAVYVKIVAADSIYNRSEVLYYFPTDNNKPELTVKDKGIVTHTDNSRYYEIKLDVTDRATPDDIKLYYRTSSDGNFVAAPFEQGYVLAGENVPAGAEKHGVIQYYAEDALGNVTETFTKYYFIGDNTSTISIVDEESYSDYIEPKPIEFTGFRAPVTEGGSTVYDYLAYRIGNDEFNYIKNTDGNNIILPIDAIPFEQDTNSSFVITYKLVRGMDETELDSYQAPEKFLIYHYDTKEPGFSHEITKDDRESISSITVRAPANGHISNVVSAEITLMDENGDMLFTKTHAEGGNIKNGELVLELSEHGLLNVAKVSSGTYSIYIKVTDRNGHISEGYIAENEIFVADNPEIKNITVSDTDSGLVFADTDNVTEDVYVSAEDIISALDGSKESASGYKYTASARIAVPYACGEYPGFFEKGFNYIYSKDDGQTWSNYSDKDLVILSEETGYAEYDGKRYAYCDVELPVPEIDDGKTENYKIRFRSEATGRVTPIMSLVLSGDRTGPSITAKTIAVGSDEKGWSEKIDFTNDFVKAEVTATDTGFCSKYVTVGIENAFDLAGREVDNIDDYAELSDNGNGTAILIFKESCKVILSASDIFGNTTEYEYGTDLIDDIVTDYKVYYNEDTEVYAYVILENVRNYILTVEPTGSTEPSEEGDLRYQQFIADSVIVNEHFRTIPAARDSDVNVAFRIYRRNNVDQPYDILCGMYDRYGNYTTFKVMTIENKTVEDTRVLEYTNTVTGLGKTVRAVQKLQFNKPVAQLRPIHAAEILESELGIDVIERDSLVLKEMVFSDTVYAVLDHQTNGNVFVTDEYGNITHIEVDTTGTEFIDYAGYSVSITDKRGDDSINVGQDHIFGSLSDIKLSFVGNNGTSAFLPDKAVFDVTKGEAVAVDAMEFCSSVDFTGSGASFSGEGTAHIADLRVANLANGDVYHDAVVINYDTNAPVHLNSYRLAKKDATEPDSVIYIFYDRRGIAKVEEDTGDGFVEKTTLGGIHRSYYNEKTEPIVRITDTEGNRLTINGPEVDGAVSVSSLREGIDYVINFHDENGNKAEDGKYYDKVYVSVTKTPGGKNFTCQPQGRIFTESEAAMTFKLTEENGVKKTVTVLPPIDVTPPTVNLFQDSYGSLVARINYTLHVNDVKSGINYVEVSRADGSGESMRLTKKDETQDYSIYSFTVMDSEEYIARAVDMLGNETEVNIVSNSKVAEPFALNVTYSTKLLTNKNVKVSIRAVDGRRIYTNIVPIDTDKALSPSDYLISGNDINIYNNGEMKVVVTDELENSIEQYIVVTNIDNKAPKIKANVTQITGEDGSVDDSFARITFSALGEDSDVPGAVRLLRLRDDIENAGFTRQELHDYWTAYTQNPDSFKETQEFKDICEKLFDHDITDENTYVDVTCNGSYLFYFVDKAGNGTTLDVSVDCIDDTPPVIKSIMWMFDYLSGEYYDTTETVSGTVTDATGKTVDVTEETTGHATNKNVNVEIETDEDSMIYGSNVRSFAKRLGSVIKSNGVYKFIISDKANNQSEVTVNVTNILKDEVYIEFYHPDDIVVFEDKIDSFKKEYVTDFKVYKYDGAENKVYLDADEYTVRTDLGGLDIDNIGNNKFGAHSPYIITYSVWDHAGNKAERTKKVTLCSKDDIMVTVNGKLPEISGKAIVGSAVTAPGYVMTDGKTATVRIENYSGRASVKIAEGQFNGAQMKTNGTEVEGNGNEYVITFGKTGWYTLSVRTIHQDIFVIRIYATVS